jgi:hypothetical protein
MAFPLRDGRRWEVTSYINPETNVLIGTELMKAYQQWDARVEEIDIADEIGSFSFTGNEVMHVLQTNTDDGSSKRYVMEKYVREIGLVMRIDTILDSRCLAIGDFTPCIGKTWMQHASKGYILKQVMTAYQ